MEQLVAVCRLSILKRMPADSVGSTSGAGTS